MSWIKTIPYDKAESQLKKLYNRIKGPNNVIDNVLLIHSLRPHTLVGHMALYKNVLHNSNNTLPKWYLEALGVYVSFLNSCDYCFQHHFVGFERTYTNKKRAIDFKNAVLQDKLDRFFEKKYFEGCRYAKELTLSQHNITEQHIINLRNVGFSDGEVLEINQVISYFNYVNRSVVGLGVNTQGDILGLSPNDSDEPNNWNHD